MPGFDPTAADIAKYRDAKLDDILVLPNPQQTKALRAWLEAGTLEEDPTVKIVVSDKKTFTTLYRNPRSKDLLTVTHAGRRVTRKLAIDLLLWHGEKGQYRGLHIPTGLDEDGWAIMKEELPGRAAIIKRQNGNKDLEFIRNYLTHQTEAEMEAEAAAKEAEKQLVAA